MQERDEILLTPAAHVQLARQRIDLIAAHLGVHPSRASTPSTSTSATDLPVEVDDFSKRCECAVVHVGSRRAQVA